MKKNILFTATFLIFLIAVTIVYTDFASTVVFAGPKPTPTAPMPGDPPPGQDWLDNMATLEAAPKREAYPPPFETPTPASYPEVGSGDSFNSNDAGIWAWIWDLFTN